jgi:high-affinity iron transporter
MSQQCRGAFARIRLRAIDKAGALLFIACVLFQKCVRAADLDPLAPSTSPVAAAIDIGVLVFREGLECILVLAAITAGLTGRRGQYRRPIASGAAAGFVATLATWTFAVRIVDDLGSSISALALQAATGLLAVIVLLAVMNWFFHRVYWTGWISAHNKKKHDLLEAADNTPAYQSRIVWGLRLLGFSSVYREGFEVVLFLQSYRLRLGGHPILVGALWGLFLSGLVAVVTFVLHRQLPYRRMLVLTGVLLSVVLLVMVGEQAQEMQLAHWLPTTPIPHLTGVLPIWLGLWFSVFPTFETLGAQMLAAVLVFGSYFIAQRRTAARLDQRE